jgi:hypothetical protein
MKAEPHIRDLYFDPSSIESSTGNIKNKQKLLVWMSRPNNVYVFIPKTTQQWVKKEKKSYYIDSDYWEVISPKFKSLLKKPGHLCWFQDLNHDNKYIHKKLMYVAKLKKERFNELKKLAEKVDNIAFQYKKTRLLEHICTLSDPQEVKETIKRIGLD